MYGKTGILMFIHVQGVFMNNSNFTEVLPQDTLLSTAARRLSLLQCLLENAEKRLQKAPKGHLRISRNRRWFQFYLITEKGDNNGTYLKRKQARLIAELAQKAFDRRSLKSIKTQIRGLQKVIKTESTLQHELDKLMKITELNGLYTKPPLRLTDRQYAALWKAVPFRTKGIAPEEQRHFSIKELPVRSKSEELIANALDAHDIPFRYEAPVRVDGIWHPDFYCLNVRTRQELIWEHFGMMDDAQYLSSALSKLKAYQAHSFLLGRDFIFSWETQAAPLSSADIELLIKAYFV